MKKNHSVEFQALWQDNRFNRAPLISYHFTPYNDSCHVCDVCDRETFSRLPRLCLIGIAVVLVRYDDVLRDG